MRVPSTFTRSRRPLDQFLGGGDADVGGEQGVLDLLPGVLVEVLARQQREQPLAERVLRAGEPGAEADEPSGRRLGDLDRGYCGAGGSSTATGAEPSGRSTSSIVRRASSRGVSASSPTCGSAGGAVMSGAEAGGGGSGFLLPAADHEPAERTEHDHGDDYSKDDDFHNASSIRHRQHFPAIPSSRALRYGPRARAVSLMGALVTVTTSVRFNLVQPPRTPGRIPAPSRSHGFNPSNPAPPPPRSAPATGPPWRWPRTPTTRYHHRPDRGAPRRRQQLAARRRSPSRARCFGATRRIAVTVSAVIGPLHDPLRLAEDIAVLDLLSGGRLVTVAGIGYRPEEYAQFDVDWKRRGRLQDEVLETLLKAWTGEEFEYRGRTVRVTPRPFSDPHPLLLVGGSSKAAARRAARLGLPFFPSAHLPELEAYYKERLAEYGTEGWT